MRPQRYPPGCHVCREHCLRTSRHPLNIDRFIVYTSDTPTNSAIDTDLEALVEVSDTIDSYSDSGHEVYMLGTTNLVREDDLTEA